MSRDQGPTDCCTYGCTQGRNCPVRSTPVVTADGGARIETDIPQPTDGGDWVLFDKTSEVIFWAGAIALAMAFFSLFAFLTIFFLV